MDTLPISMDPSTVPSVHYSSEKETCAEDRLLYLWYVSHDLSHDLMPMRGDAYALSKWIVAKKEIKALEYLPSNWDGHGGYPVTAKTLDNTIRFLDVLATWTTSIPIPDITPTPHGTISLAWEIDSIEASIEIGNTRYSGYLRIDGHPPALFDGRSDDRAHAHNIFASSLAALILEMRCAGLSSITSVSF